MDDFREWLSDNLRYFELGGAILLVVLVLFFGIRACGKSRRSSDTNTTETQVTSDAQDVPDEEGASAEGSSNPLVPADEDVEKLIRAYYQAYTDRDVEAVRALVDDLSPTDEPLITNTNFENYKVQEVKTKNGLTEDSRVVYVTYTYQCAGISTPVPTASWLYVYRTEDADGKSGWIIDSDAASDPDISDYMNSLKTDEDVVELTGNVRTAYEETLASNPDLAAYLNGLGQSVSSTSASESGTIMVATEAVNIRSSSSNGEIIGGLDEGDQISVIRIDGDWAQVNYNGQTAYVFAEYLTAPEESAESVESEESEGSETEE